jgi:hypothetical protein
VEEKLIDLLEQREAAAQTYIEIATRYNIPLDIFGEKIPIQSIGGLERPAQRLSVRAQIAEYLQDNDRDGLNWESLYGRVPDKKLRLAICLELLRDDFLKNLNGKKPVDSKEMPPAMNGSSQLIDKSKIKQKILKEGYTLLKEQRSPEIIYREWASLSMRTITNGPWGEELEGALSNATKVSLEDLSQFVESSFSILEKARHWQETNTKTLSNRLQTIKTQIKDFDPNSPKWQQNFIKRLREENIDLKDQIAQEEPRQEPHQELPPEIPPTVVIVGEKHGSPNNGQAFYKLLESGKAHGFKNLTIEEPRTTPWAPYIEFAQTLNKSLNNKPLEIEQKAKKFCLERGISDKSMAQKLMLIHLGKVFSYNIKFVDIEAQKKAELTEKRKEKNEIAIINSPETQIEDPISALGGTKAFAQSIVATYKDCLLRSKEMSKLILEVSESGKTIHVGGILHSLDIQQELSKAMGKKPTVITLDEKEKESIITKELGKYPKECPKNGVVKLDPTNLNITRRLEAIFSGEYFKAKSQTVPKSLNKEQDELVLS